MDTHAAHCRKNKRVPGNYLGGHYHGLSRIFGLRVTFPLGGYRHHMIWRGIHVLVDNVYISATRSSDPTKGGRGWWYLFTSYQTISQYLISRIHRTVSRPRTVNFPCPPICYQVPGTARVEVHMVRFFVAISSAVVVPSVVQRRYLHGTLAVTFCTSVA